MAKTEKQLSIALIYFQKRIFLSLCNIILIQIDIYIESHHILTYSPPILPHSWVVPLVDVFVQDTIVYIRK